MYPLRTTSEAPEIVPALYARLDVVLRRGEDDRFSRAYSGEEAC